jgi:hypothetical protein
MALLACGVAMLGVTYAGEVARQQAREQGHKPRPTPQMMAPGERPPLDSNGMVYAIGTSYVGSDKGY